MNALITDADLLQAARNLDPKRCWEQAIECKQMLKGLYALESSGYYQAMPKRCSVCYWIGQEQTLAHFGWNCCYVSEQDHEYDIDITLMRFLNAVANFGVDFMPWFLQPGNEWFAHQKALLCSKDQHYRDLWPDVAPDPVRYYPVAGEPGEFVTRGD